MNEHTHAVAAEVNGTYGLTLEVEALEERIAPGLLGGVGSVHHNEVDVETDDNEVSFGGSSS
jgi:hypothetical protein